MVGAVQTLASVTSVRWMARSASKVAEAGPSVGEASERDGFNLGTEPVESQSFKTQSPETGSLETESREEEPWWTQFDEAESSAADRTNRRGGGLSIVTGGAPF